MTIIETGSGKVRGFTANGVNVFLSIPFAKPPVGELRWQGPQDPEPWSGIKELGSDYGAQSWQSTMDDMGPLRFAFNADALRGFNEDCLYLNVWTPATDRKKRPVLVWIHGGGFSGGTGGTPLYDGTSLAARGDAVVVTINYRLGALGFLNLNEVTGGRIPSTGNEGLLDQVKALEWVRDNIEAFGGDPDRVTIFGESAGGMSVGALLTFGPARRLFHRAIPQSGACSTAQTIERAAEVAEAVLASAGISANAPANEFLAIDPAKLVDAGTAAGLALGNAMIFQPCIDGEQLPDIPLNDVEAGVADGIPIMVGATKDEWRLFTSMPGFEVEFDDEALEQFLSTNIDEPGRVIDTYRDAREGRGESATANDLFAAIETDRIFRMPAIDLADRLVERGEKAFEYLFTQTSPWGDGGLGSPHAIDLGFVFGTCAYSAGSAEFFGQGDDVERLTETVQDAWLAFAADGDPSTPDLPWSAYDSEQRPTAIFGQPSEVVDDPFGAERAVWNEVNARIGSL